MDTILKNLNLAPFSAVIHCKARREATFVILAKNQNEAYEKALVLSTNFDDVLNVSVDELYIDEAGCAQVSDYEF